MDEKNAGSGLHQDPVNQGQTKENTAERPDVSPEENTALGPGQQLEQLRRAKGLSVEEASSATRVSANNIRAIEAEEFDSLPADTFVRGQVTLYGNFLGADGASLAADFLAARNRYREKGRRTRSRKKRAAHLAPKKLAEPAHVSSATVALLLLAAIVTSFAGFCFYTSWNPFDFLVEKFKPRNSQFPVLVHPSAPPSPGQPPAPVTGNKTVDLPDGASSPAAPSPPADAPLTYTLKASFLKNTTVTVTLDGQKPEKIPVRAGESRTWKADHSLQITFADPDAAALECNGTRLLFPKGEASGPPTLTLPDDFLDQ